jgi:drug/metabolite transporter (DMT)-like permease
MPLPRHAVFGFHLGVTWLVWGTAYLAIAASLDGLPPFTVSAARFALAGVALIGLGRLAARRPLGIDRRTLGGSLWVGFWLVAVGDGAIIWAVQHVPSGQVAVLVGTTPLFAVGLEALERRAAPPIRSLGAASLGLAGVAAIALADGPAAGAAEAAVPTGSYRAAGIAATLAGSLAWAYAALAARRAPLPPSAAAAMGLQLIFGGAFLVIPAAALGEWPRLDPAPLAGRAGLALLYLTLACSMLGFWSYMWLLREARPAVATSFAYVNPVVAVWAGHLAFGETLGPQVLAGTALVVAAVLLLPEPRER